jgi:predicted amidophosphoribosyltransferase
MEEGYYCQKCGAEIKSTDTICPKCGSNLKEVGRRIELHITETIGVSARFEKKLTKEQSSILKKVYRALKRELAKKELVFSIYPDGHISFTIKNKKEDKNGDA